MHGTCKGVDISFMVCLMKTSISDFTENNCNIQVKLFHYADFVMPPQSINATLNSTAVFSCQTANISNHIWRINNTLTPAMSSTVDMTILEVFCSEDQDMSVVECGGRLLNRTRIFSDPALLRVQGLFILGI